MNIMSKGIAIDTILMLLVGILVVGIVVYLVYRYMLSPGLDEPACRTEAINWCTNCRTLGCLQDPLKTGCDAEPPDALNTCAPKYFPGNPKQCSDAKSWCPSFIGTS
jgi:hypothetical protein